MMHKCKCSTCGRFMGWREPKSSWVEIYSGRSGLDREYYRCQSCTEKLGPAESNAAPYDKDMSSYQEVFK